jgi:5-methylcytosine-specific restriction protein A
VVDWLYDELLIIGAIVRQNNWRGIRASSPEAKALSALLSKGQLHPGVNLPDDFRTANSIQRKSYDLVSAAQGYTGIPTKGGKLAGVVMDAFQTDPEGMHAKADAVRKVLEGAFIAPKPATDEDPDEKIAASEGGIIEVLARRRERDKGLRTRKLAAVEKAGRTITCEACGFDFGAVYGERGDGYIEVHHVNPLHVTGPVETSLDDLALVCANCHRICHRGLWITPSAVAALIAERG